LFFYEKFDLSFNKEKIIENIDVLEGKFLSVELVNNRIKYLNGEFKKFNKLNLFEKVFKHRYFLFDKKELDTLVDNCAKYVIKEIKKVMV